jgi:putative DNA primase/helicase
MSEHPADSLPILRHGSARMSKHWLPDGTLKPYDDAKYFRLEEQPVGSLADLSAALTALEGNPHACVIRGRWCGASAAEGRDPEYRHGKVRRALAQFDDAPRHWMLVDVDRFEPVKAAPIGDEDRAITEFVRAVLPPAFWGVDCHWQYSSSAGSAGAGKALKLHLWFWLEHAVDSATLTAWAKSLDASRGGVDAAVFRVVQPHYTALPTFAEGVTDPIAVRSGYYEGLADDTVRMTWDRAAFEAAARERGATGAGTGGEAATGGGRHVVLRGVASADPVGARLLELGLVKNQARGGELNIICPFAELHTGGAAGAAAAGADTATQYFPAHTHGFRVGNFKCLHAHCDGRPRLQWLARLDLRDEDGEIVRGAEGEPSAEGFGPVEDGEDSESGGVPGFGAIVDDEDEDDFWSPGPPRATAKAAPLADVTLPEIDLKSIPQAKHLCTDQANARRLERKFARKAFVADGVWHTWDGRRWAKDERDVWVMACKLSAIVKGEAAAWLAKTAADASEAKVNAAVAAALEKWSTKCEMKGTIEAAVGLVRKILSVDGARLDADPWALNCQNGTVDLRSGELKAHDPSDYITKICGVRYRPELFAKMASASVGSGSGKGGVRASAGGLGGGGGGGTAGVGEGEPGFLWRRTVSQIMLEEHGFGVAGGPMVDFLRRWSGYCASGSVREQVFVVNYGDGRNGKSTLLEALTAALGDYAGVAAPGLLNGGKGAGERHPTEIADLRGRRMVTAHESGEGCVLREDFIKSATGGDVMKARVMRGDFFEFRPTHKLQLLTNHKPTIKGQDAGIWRRVLLVPYMARFGDAAAVAAGTAHYARDVDLMARLMAPGELEAVLAWIVAGAVEWAADGLRPPESVLAASRAYQGEQDRIGQFLEECCEVACTLGQALGKTEEEAGALARARVERTGTALTLREAVVIGDALGPFRVSLGGGSGAGLYPAYQGWCKETGTLPQSRQRFLAGLEKLVPGFEKREREKTVIAGVRKSVTFIYGVRLLESDFGAIED